MTSLRQSSFATGEVAPEIYGATNDPRYSTALRTCKNFLPIQHGALVNRPGTRLDAQTKNGGLPYVRPFIFSDLQAIVMEFGDGYVRFHAAGGPILNAGVPVEVATPYAIADVPLLKFAQSGDVITITHRSYQTRDLSRLSNINWTLALTDFAPPTGFVVKNLRPVSNGFGGDTATVWSNASTYLSGQYAFDAAAAVPAAYIALAPNLNKQPSASAAYWALAVDGTHIPRVWDYVVTIKFKDSFGRNREGLPCAKLGGPNVLRANDRPIACQWDLPDPVPFSYVITGFGVYAGRNGLFGWVGDADATATSFKDDGTNAPDFSVQPPKGTNPFAVADGANSAGTFSWPACSVYHEQRRVYGGSDARPQDFNGSAAGDFGRFDVNDPVQDTDTYQFRVSSAKLEQIRNMASIRHLVLLTGQGEFSATGAPGIGITPRSIQVRKHSDHGSSFLAPITIGNLLLFVTAKGNYLRDLVYDFQSDSYVSSDLTSYGRHLFDGHVITDWCYTAVRYPVVWAVRDDGLLLSLTYDRAAQTLAWAQHPTAGQVHSVCSVPEGTEDVVYLVVQRATGVFIERMSSRLVTDIRYANFLDCAVQFDGHNTGGTTMQVSGASYNALDEVTVAASGAAFVVGAGSTDIGDRIVLDPDGLADGPYYVTIQAVTDATHATGVLEQALPAALQNAATASWAWARDTIGGLSHLIGQEVAVLADGALQKPFTVDATGSIGPLKPPAIVVQAGLAYTSDAELMDVAHEQGRSSVKSVSAITWEVVASGGIQTGQDFDHLRPAKLRKVSDGFGAPVLVTDQVLVPIDSSWNKSGRAVIRQVDPLPLTIVAAIREVELGGKGTS